MYTFVDVPFVQTLRWTSVHIFPTPVLKMKENGVQNDPEEDPCDTF